MQKVILQDLGNIRYDAAWQLQEKLFQDVVQIKIQNRTLLSNQQIAQEHYFLLCEHPPVFTLGKNANHAHILMQDAFLESKGIEKFPINRGGDVTFHGPGQIVGYPILDLDFFITDIGLYLRNIEEVIIRTLKDFEIAADRLKGVTGVWLNPDDPLNARKICAIGIRCSRWVTMHGFALNVNTDMSYFDYIVPCGIQDKKVTSMQKELAIKLNMQEVKERICFHFQQVFNCTF